MKHTMRTFNPYTLFMFVYFLSGCSGHPKIDSIEEYLRWLNKEESGLVKIRHIHGIELKVKFLPTDYWMYLERSKTNPGEGAEHGMSIDQQSITFLMCIGPDERKNKGKDIMWQGIFSYPEYKERMHQLNFALQDRVSLRLGNHTYQPVLARMENVYGLQPSRNIIFVFVPSASEHQDGLQQYEKIDFVFEDDLFDTGINHFVFRTEDIENTPHFTL